jgi:hypothetical protein
MGWVRVILLLLMTLLIPLFWAAVVLGPPAWCLARLAAREPPSRLTLGASLAWIAALAVLFAALAESGRAPGLLLFAPVGLYVLPFAFLARHAPRRAGSCAAVLWFLASLAAMVATLVILYHRGAD